MLRALLFATPLLLIAAAPPADKSNVGKGCTNHGVDYATALPDPGSLRRLDQLPPANEILTVLRSVDGCEKPVIVRYNVGGNASPAK